MPNGQGKRGNGGEFDDHRPLFRAARHQPRGPRAARRCSSAVDPRRARARRHLRHDHRRRALSHQRSAGHHRLQGGRRQPLRSRRQGRAAVRVPAERGLPRTSPAALARGLRHGPTGGTRGIRHRACWRRHLQHPRAAHHHGHRHRHAAARRGGVAPGRHGRRPPLCQRHHRRRRARAEAVASAMARG